MMADFDFSAVLAAATKVPTFSDDGRWRCVVYLSAFDWMNGWRVEPDLAAQSLACKAWISDHPDLKKAETIRNRNAQRNVYVAFSELMEVIENRRADCVVVPNIAVLATCGSEARFYVEEVLAPMGFRFIDCARRFDSLNGDVREYLKGIQAEMSEARALQEESGRLSTGRLLKKSVPYGYVYDESAECGVRVDDEVARFVPAIFELAAQERWWRTKIEEQVRALGCPGLRQRSNELYGEHHLSMEGWDAVSIRRVVSNPFYTGDFVPIAHASIRMLNSGIDLDSFPVIENHHYALVSRELFDAANAGVERNRCACPTEAEGRRPCHG